MIRISQIRKFDSANGNGIGVTLFCSGCLKRCKNCFNSELQSFNTGEELTPELIDKIINYLNNPHVNHLSLLGGDFLDQDLEEVRDFLRIVKEKAPGKKIWLWSGYIYESMLNSEDFIDKMRCKIIQDFADYFIDGPYIESLGSNRIMWRGSTNQVIYKRNDFDVLEVDEELMNTQI